MLKMIRSGKDIGVAEQIQGQTVDVSRHPQWKYLWTFKFGEATWVASDNAFVTEG